MREIPLSLLPDLQTLTVGVTSVLEKYDSASGQVTILGRRSNVNTASFHSEIVTCRVLHQSKEIS